MFMTIDCPDELFADAVVPGVMTGTGVRLEAVEDVPAGPWLAALLDLVDPCTLSDWDMPAYLRACARMQAWAAARLSDGCNDVGGRTATSGWASGRDRDRRRLADRARSAGPSRRGAGRWHRPARGRRAHDRRRGCAAAAARRGRAERPAGASCGSRVPADGRADRAGAGAV